MVEVNYRGGGMDGVTSNAASEATLLRVLKALESGGKGGGTGGKIQEQFNKAQQAGILGQQKSTDAIKEGTKTRQENTGAVKKATDKLKDMTKAVDKYTFGLVSGLGNAVKATGDLAIEVLAGGDRLSDFSKHVTGLASKIPLVGGLLGGAAQTFVNIIEGQVDTFRELSNAGIDFGGDLFEIRRKAAEAGISMETLAGTLAENSSMLATAFGGASAGATRFTNITREIQKNQGTFSALGMTMQDVTEFTADYIEMQKIQGRVTQMSDRQLAKGTNEYIMQLDQLSKITGMSRKQAAEELKQQSTDKRLKNLFASMEEGTKKQVQGVLAVVGNASPQMKEAITELVATGGVPISDFAKSLGRTNPEILEMARGLKNGTVTQDQFVEALKEAQQKAAARAKAEGGMIATLSALGSTAYDANSELMSLGFVSGNVADAVDAQAKAQENGRKGILNFESAITKLRNIIVGKILDSGVFEGVMKEFNKLTIWLSSPEGTKKMKEMFDGVSNFLEGFIADFKTMKFSELIDKYLIKPLKAMVFGEKAVDKKAAVNTEYDKKIAAAGGAGTDEGKKLIAEKEKLLAEADKEGDSGGLLGSLIPDIGFKEMAIGLGVVSAAVIAVGAAGSLASPGLLLVAAAFTGIGVAGFGIAALIEAITTGVGKLADGVIKFENMDSKKLGDVGKALGPLTDNMMQLAKGGIVASFIGEGAFEKLSAGLKSFEDLNPQQMQLIGPALASLHKGISAFTGDGVMDSFGKFLGSLFGNDGNFDDLAEGLKSFADIDAAGLEKIGNGLQGIAKFMEAMDKADLDEVADSLKELTKEIGNYQAAYSKMDADTKASIEKMINVSTEGQNGAEAKLDRLNSLNAMMLEELKKQTKGIRENGFGM